MQQPDTSSTSRRQAPPASAPGRGFALALAAMVLVVLLLRLNLVFRLNVNWDEFYFLHHVYAYLRGELVAPLQTFHVHFLTWLPGVAQNEVDQIVAARLVIFVLLVASTALTYLIARAILDRAAAAFSVLCYLTLSYAVEHGTSFRADPIASFLFLASLALLVKGAGSIAGAAGSGLVAAAAVMITIKSVFYLPVLGVVLLAGLLDREEWRRSLWRILAFAAAFLASLAALYLLHAASLAEPTLEATGRQAGASASKVIMLDNLFPRWRYLVRTLIHDMAIWLMLLLGAVYLAVELFRARPWPSRRALLLLSFLLPLGTLAFYRNAFPYYYVFLLTPAAIVCGVVFQRLLPSREAARSKLSYGIALLLVVAVSLGFARSYLENAENRTAEQRKTVALVHEIFPEPVAYIGRTTTVTSFRHVGFFMSTWGLEIYRARGTPMFRDLIIEEEPLFLLATRAQLDLETDQGPYRESGYALFEEDYRVLQNNYVHHWGDLYLAGKTLRFGEDGQAIEFEILIAGRYTLEASGPVEIDGEIVTPGSAISLSVGSHRARSQGEGTETALLRWGERPSRPDEPASGAPFFERL